MKILFFESNPVWIHGMPNGFRDAGHRVMVSGPLTRRNIPALLSEFKPDLAVAMGWGTENTPAKTEWIRKNVKEAGVPLIYWAVEDPAFLHQWSLPLVKRLQPDYVFTISKESVKAYRNHGFRASHLDFAYHSSVHTPAGPEPRYRSSIAVIANAYPDVLLGRKPDLFRVQSLQTLVGPLIAENIRVDFWGKNWNEMGPLLGRRIPKDWIHGYLPYTEANKVYSSAKIVIGLQNYQNQLTQRTYEILASGGFLLTSHTEAVNRTFANGRDLIVSSSPQETVELVKYYLDHPQLRRLIKNNGRNKVSSHDYKTRAESILQVLKENGVLQRRSGAGLLPKFGRANKPVKHLKTEAVYHVNTAEKAIALTFDIGWGGQMPPRVLDLLQQKNVKNCTFFLSSTWVEKYPDVALRIKEMGFEIGSHGCLHENYSEYKDSWIEEQVRAAEATIRKVMGVKTRLIRTPNGDISKRVLNKLASLDYSTILWDIDSLDWKNPGPKQISHNVLSKLHPGGIVLAHASDSSRQIVEALPGIIDTVRRKGYELLTVSQLLLRGR